MNIVKNSWGKWEDDLICDFLHFPKLLQVPESEVWARFRDIQGESRLGRSIYKDWVLIDRAGRPMQSYLVSIHEEGGNQKRLPNPCFYAKGL